MNKQDLIELVLVRTPGTPAEHRDVRMRLERMSTGDLEKIAADFTLAAIRAEVQNSPEIAESQKKIDEINADRQRMYQEQAFLSIFRTPISVNGKWQVAIDNQGNRGFIAGWLQEDQGEQLSPAWFTKVLAEQPQLARQITWQSADLLDPRKQKEAAAAQAEQDRETFNAFVREYGFSQVEANFQLAKSVLGNFDKYMLAQAVQSNALQLAPASSEELAQFLQDAAEERQDFLINRATPLELRQAARYES